MVKKIRKDGREYFQCEECSFYYKTEALAKKCEDWCNEHHSCNIEITKDAVQPE